MQLRHDGRKHHQLRDIRIELGTNPYAEGSCTVSFGATKVLCTATVEESVPRWLRGRGGGWVSAEYSMLPRATHQRCRRETATRTSGRTMEVQRLIGRSLRAITDTKVLGERQIMVDCDVLVADGGTRTAAITGGWVALQQACAWLYRQGKTKKSPIIDNVAAVSCGVVQGRCVLDLDYAEDSSAHTDANFVMTGAGKFVEIQGTAEQTPFDDTALAEMIALAKAGISQLIDMQRGAVGTKPNNL